jgi:hypothetical protein
MPLLLFHPTFDDIDKGYGKIRIQIMPLLFIKSSLQLRGIKSKAKNLRPRCKNVLLTSDKIAGECCRPVCCDAQCVGAKRRGALIGGKCLPNQKTAARYHADVLKLRIFSL